jgi:hypothetical protein
MLLNAAMALWNTKLDNSDSQSKKEILHSIMRSKLSKMNP